VIFFATVVVVEVWDVVGLVATVVADDVGLANASVVVGPMLTTFLSITGALGAVVCGIIGKALVGMGDLFNPVAYEEVGPAFTALLLMATFLVFSLSPSLPEPPQALTTTSETAVKERAKTRGEIRIPLL